MRWLRIVNRRGLALVGDQDPQVEPYSECTGNTNGGISCDGDTDSQHIQLGGISADARTRITNSALEMLRRYLLKMSVQPAGFARKRMDIINPLVIFFVGLVVSVLGTLIGGSSLFTIPTLILLGLSPHSAIGTDRFGIMGICSAGWLKFHQKRLINYRVGLTLAVPVFFGAFIGANLVFEVSESVLKLIIIIISLFSLAFLILDPTRGIQSTARCIGRFEYLVGGAMTFVVGIYVGFYGAMGATLLLYILVLWFGQTFLESAGTLKIAALVMNAMAAVVFALNGAVDYSLALPMFCGCFIGSYFGAHYADKIGNIWIKRLFIVLLFCLIVKLIV